MSNQYSIGAENFWSTLNALHSGPFAGIYKLHVLGENPNGFRPLPRLLAEDPYGVLYIGTSASVPNRLGSLKKSVVAAYRIVAPDLYGQLPYTDANPHQAGRKIVRVGRKFAERFAFEKLCVTVERYQNIGPAVVGVDYGYFGLEDRMLRDYEALYGERPALNG